MAESILDVTNITLFGRVVDDIAVSSKPASKKKFARIYGFASTTTFLDRHCFWSMVQELLQKV